MTGTSLAAAPPRAWICVPCSFEANAEYREPPSAEARCASCGQVANPCALLRIELRALRQEVAALHGEGRAARRSAGGEGTGETLTPQEAAAYLRLPSVRALYQAVRRGQVPVHRFGPRRMRFHRAELDAVLALR
ncbi:DNA binding domain, excisionase family [Anaeromyxobacter sp. Fw109-5]|nr:DNA binding domain, excisionase family [Anaeromyxobacter sp. Fw109-5]